MSDTTYVHEVSQRAGVRVTLTMDAAEARALADIAAAAIDGAIMLAEAESRSIIVSNAENVFKWADKAANALEVTEAMKRADDQE